MVLAVLLVGAAGIETEVVAAAHCLTRLTRIDTDAMGSLNT
jgi:hypothetical protein